MEEHGSDQPPDDRGLFATVFPAGEWEVRWYGQIRASKTTSKTKVALLLEMANGNVRVWREIGIGLLSAVPIGSRWRDGRRVSRFREKVSRHRKKPVGRTHLLDCREPEFVDYLCKLDDGEWLIPREEHSLKAKKCWLTRLLALPSGDDPFGFLIPTLEVFRAYYCSDAHVPQILMSMRWENARDQIFNAKDHEQVRYQILEREGVSPEDWTVKLRMRTSNASLRLAATLANCDVAQRRAKRIFDSMTARYHSGNLVVPDVSIPVSDTVKIRASSMRICENPERWLITRIRSTTFPCPTIHYLRDNRNRATAPEDQTRATAGWNSAATSRDFRSSDKSDIQYETETTADSTVEHRRLLVDGVTFMDMVEENEVVLPMVTEQQDTPIVPRKKPTSGTEGQEKSRRTGAGEIHTGVSGEEQDDVPVSPKFSTFARAAAAKLGCRLSWRAQNKRTGTTGFPDVGDQGARKWSQVEKKRQRCVWIAEYELKDKVAYCLEIEHYKSAEGYCMLGLVKDNDNSPVESHVLLEILIGCARVRGKWVKGRVAQGDAFPGIASLLRWKKMRHAYKTPETFAEAFAEWVLPKK